MLDDSKAIFGANVYIESIEDIIAKKIVYRRNDNLTRDIIDIAISIKHADNILEKLFVVEKINRGDIQDLYNSIEKLDKETFNEEIEIVAPFEKYTDDAINAPSIISETCRKLLM